MKDDYQKIANAIRFIRENHQQQPQLDEVAEQVNLSPYHFQRLFARWAGVSPKRFLQFLTVGHAKTLLTDSASILDATFEVGLSSPGRLHDHFVQLEGVTPGDYKRLGEELTISYGEADTLFGRALIGFTERGICRLSFVEDADSERQAWTEDLPKALWQRDQARAKSLLKEVFDPDKSDKPLHLAVAGTNFQINVWKALLQIPEGSVCSYQQIAKQIGRPTSSRAVANAIGSNPVAYLVPCHRVIRGEGSLGGYRWSPTRKQAILAWESAKLYQEPQMALAT
ncbi:MAG: methylated-DNA--[protein]-cysteine S-methyltransferase [Pseudomonadota bacterium]